MKNMNLRTPAKVRYIGKSEKNLTQGKIYDAYFLEYWQGVRNSLHIRDDSGKVTDFHPYEEFELIEDKNNIINDYEAIEECVTHTYDDELFDLKFGKKYKAIGRDKDGMYLVMDESWDCYFYPSECFKIIEDEHRILAYESIYYSFG